MHALIGDGDGGSAWHLVGFYWHTLLFGDNVMHGRAGIGGRGGVAWGCMRSAWGYMGCMVLHGVGVHGGM